mmetsp:Transcript_18672/g.58359  ORF Transcript_18672/g.58359 Transcript_18672/m.58359 type:complete len:291 (+) Transcript_18672:292-1164(+)
MRRGPAAREAAASASTVRAEGAGDVPGRPVPQRAPRRGRAPGVPRAVDRVARARRVAGRRHGPGLVARGDLARRRPPGAHQRVPRRDVARARDPLQRRLSAGKHARARRAGPREAVDGDAAAGGSTRGPRALDRPAAGHGHEAPRGRHLRHAAGVTKSAGGGRRLRRGRTGAPARDVEDFHPRLRRLESCETLGDVHEVDGLGDGGVLEAGGARGGEWPRADDAPEAEHGPREIPVGLHRLHPTALRDGEPDRVRGLLGAPRVPRRKPAEVGRGPAAGDSRRRARGGGIG